MVTGGAEPVDETYTRAWEQLTEFRVLLDLTAERSGRESLMITGVAPARIFDHWLHF